MNVLVFCDQSPCPWSASNTHATPAGQVRSQHFFEAAGVVAELRASLERTYGQVLDMRGAVQAVDGDVVQASATVQVRDRSCRQTG